MSDAPVLSRKKVEKIAASPLAVMFLKLELWTSIWNPPRRMPRPSLS
jgi:hypothetical protein